LWARNIKLALYVDSIGEIYNGRGFRFVQRT